MLAFFYAFIILVHFDSILVNASAICFECFANSTEAGKFCSIDKLCSGTSCYFEYRSDGSWEAGCSSELASSSNITCSASSSSYSCSCNSDFCNSFKESQSALTKVAKTTKKSWLIFSWDSKKQQTISLTLPNQTMVYCEECGSVTVDGQTIEIPCNHDHTCQGNYCVSVRGEKPYSYCGGVWDEVKDAACYHVDDQPEKCICSMNMCNILLEPSSSLITTPALSDPTIASVKPIENNDNTVTTTIPANIDAQATTTKIQMDEGEHAVLTPPTTQKPVTKKKCKNKNFSPNDRAVFMGEKLKDVIIGGFGKEDGAVQQFEDDINDHICNYSDDDE